MLNKIVNDAFGKDKVCFCLTNGCERAKELNKINVLCSNTKTKILSMTWDTCVTFFPFANRKFNRDSIRDRAFHYDALSFSPILTHALL